MPSWRRNSASSLVASAGFVPAVLRQGSPTLDKLSKRLLWKPDASRLWWMASAGTLDTASSAAGRSCVRFRRTGPWCSRFTGQISCFGLSFMHSMNGLTRFTPPPPTIYANHKGMGFAASARKEEPTCAKVYRSLMVSKSFGSSSSFENCGRAVKVVTYAFTIESRKSSRLSAHTTTR